MRIAISLAYLATFASSIFCAELPVATDREFHLALQKAQPGDVIRLGAGPFGGSFYFEGLQGTAEQPIIIAGPSPEKPAMFHTAEQTIFHFVQAQHVVFENLHITRAGGHGIACDDGGREPFSCHHITVRHVRIDDVGPHKTYCSVKFAGVADFTIADCTFDRWGDGGGCAVDGVGCKNGVVERCQFLPGRGSVGIQFKGGSDEIAIRRCRIDAGGSRAVNVGGSTGLKYFRPTVQPFEARNVTIEGNVIVGSDASLGFPNTDGAVVRFNTIYLPKKWAFRILQESPGTGFTPSRNVKIEDNVVVFDSKQWFEGGVNVGPGTAPETFAFARNVWYCVDQPARSQPKLPTKETDSLVGQDPQFVDPAKPDLSLRPTSPARGRGHTALPPR